MWFALLHRAGFDPPASLTAPINFRDNVKNDLVQNVTGIRTTNNGSFHTGGQPISVLRNIYRQIAALYRQHGNNRDWFPDSSDGSSYFNDIESG